MSRKNAIVRGNDIFHERTGQKVGEVKPNGTCVGPHPWTDDVIVCNSPEQLRAAQRKLARTECV